jgi:hypothetical protein
VNTLGIRVKPCSVIIAVYDFDNSLIINVEDIKIPKALPTPEALKYVRNSVLDILREFNIEKAALRIVESNSQTLNKLKKTVTRRKNFRIVTLNSTAKIFEVVVDSKCRKQL